MPTVTRAVEITFPEAVLLADLYEIASDLDAAEGLCKKVLEIANLSQRDYFVEEGLVSAAIVKYGRCFTEGVRLSLKLGDLSELDEQDLAAHDYYIALRHKFIAHAVNAFEETYVTASAREKDGTRLPIESLGSGQHRMLLTGEVVPSLVRLVGNVKAIIKKRVSEEESVLLEFIQTLPLDTIHAGDLHTPELARPEQVHRSRVRGVHSNNALKCRRAKRARP